MREFRDVVEDLCAFEGRGSCTDAERRAALWLHDELRARGHEAWVETVWVRPQWWWSLFWHAGLGIAASVVATASAVAGLALAAAVLVSYLLELAGAGGLLSLVFFRRATQLVVVEPPDPDAIALYLTANTDAPRRGLVFRDGFRRLGARLRPGPLWWVALALAVVAATALARLLGAEGVGVGIPQFLATLVLLLAAAAALDIALSEPSPGAADGASGVALALALHEELTAGPPQRLSAGLLLAGAGELFPLGLRHHLRRERPSAQGTVLLELGPVGAGTPAWSTRHPQLVAACRRAAEPAVRRPMNRPSAAGAARARRIPAVTVRGLDGAIAPRARTAADRPDAVDEAAADRARAFALDVVAALDAGLSAR